MLNLAPFFQDAVAEIVLQLMRDRNAMLSALSYIRDETEARMDVEDGFDGQPRPDWVMQLFTEADTALKTAGVR